MRGAEVFLDTNVLLYLLSGDADKANRAEELIADGSVISVQVLNEFASVASRKFGMAWSEIREILDTVRAVCRTERLTVEAHDCGLGIAERYGFAIYDSMIVAAALLAGCTRLFSEDFQDGQQLEEQLVVRNPFRIQFR